MTETKERETKDISLPPSIESLQDSFLLSLHERIALIEMHWQALLEAEDKRSKMGFFVSTVHYLAGAAGVYGLISMSKRAYDIIAHLQPCIEKNVALTPTTQHHVERLIQSLSGLLAYYKEHGRIAFHTTEEKANAVARLPEVAVSETEIFVLEQNPEEEHALRVFLENAQLHIRPFASLHKLTKALEQKTPYAVIIDLQQSLRDATTHEFLTSLQQRPPSCPVVVLSESGDFAERLEAARLGATHFLSKPFDGYRLVDTIYNATHFDATLPSRVLLVDDDPDTSQYIAVHLRIEGLEVRVLNDPTQVLEAMAQFHPDLILTDLYMPECNGLELAAVVRQHEVYFDIPIVFLSSETDEETRLAALQLGSDDFLTKSIDLDIVAKAIKSRLERMASYALVKKAMMWSPN